MVHTQQFTLHLRKQMESLITQFEAIKTQMLAFEAALKNTIPPSMPDPNNIIDQAKAKARADIQARTDARVAELRATPNMFQQERVSRQYIPAKQYLNDIEQTISRIEGERSLKRRQQAFERKRARVVAKIREENPSLSIAEVYRLAHKFPAVKPSKFALMCAAVRTAHPTLSKDEVWVQARMRLKVKECLPGLAALNNN